VPSQGFLDTTIEAMLARSRSASRVVGQMHEIALEYDFEMELLDLMRRVGGAALTYRRELIRFFDDNWNSSEAGTDPVKRDTREFGRPSLVDRYRKRTRQRSRRDDLAGCEWRIDLIARQHIDDMTQCRHGPPNTFVARP
jgi:hypothetical protein